MNIKICSKCGALMHWDSYFHAYMCQNCRSSEDRLFECPNCGSDGHIPIDSMNVCTRCGSVYVDTATLIKLIGEKQ